MVYTYHSHYALDMYSDLAGAEINNYCANIITEAKFKLLYANTHMHVASRTVN